VNKRFYPRIGRLLGDARFSFLSGSGEDLLRQGLFMLACYAAYDISRAFVQGREAVAMANGLFFMNAEKAMHIWWEPWLQAKVSDVPGLMSVLVWTYQMVHLPVIIVCLIAIFTQRRAVWPRFRNWFLAMNFMAVSLFFLLPTAPPRMILTSGVVDFNYLHGARAAILENGILANPFAAMPSLHFGYALFIALAVYMLVQRRWLRVAAFGYPLLVLVAIVATGNHFIVDAIGGALVVLAAYLFAANLQPGRATQSAAVPVRERNG
jgi:membrane-associated phospholipid phosphatase